MAYSCRENYYLLQLTLESEVSEDGFWAFQSDGLTSADRVINIHLRQLSALKQDN